MFASILGTDDPEIPIQPLSGGNYAISVPFSQHATDGRVAFFETLVGPAEIDGLIYCEIVFQIKVISLDGSFEEFTTQTSDVARPYIPDELRPKLIELLQRCCISLVNTMDHSLIYFVTKDYNLPERALIKYYLLRDSVISCGYVVDAFGTDPMGRAFWKLARTPG